MTWLFFISINKFFSIKHLLSLRITEETIHLCCVYDHLLFKKQWEDFFFLINLIKHCGVGFFAMQTQGLNTRVIQICMAGMLSASYSSDHLSSCVIVFLFFFFNLKSKKKKVKLILTIYIPIYCILLYILYIAIDTQYFYIYSFSGYIEQIISRLKISFLQILFFNLQN